MAEKEKGPEYKKNPDAAPADDDPDKAKRKDAADKASVGEAGKDQQIDYWKKKIREIKNDVGKPFEADPEWKNKSHGIVTEPAAWAVREATSPAGWLYRGLLAVKAITKPFKWFWKAEMWFLGKLEEADKTGSIKQVHHEHGEKPKAGAKKAETKDHGHHGH